MNPGAETFTVQLTRAAAGQPWGFRLQGGADFATPLSVQSVNPGSLAENAGLRSGDAVLQINSRPSDELEHEQAKQEIVASGNTVTLVVQRGMVTIWKPKVTPMSELAPQGGVSQLPASATEGDAYIQKTSLAANKPEFQNIGSKYNRSARPFLGSQPAAAAGPVNMQYNSPANLYSAESATDAYTAQSAALQSGMQSLSVGGGTQTDGSSTQQAADDSSTDNTSAEEKSGQFLTATGSETPTTSGPRPAYSQSPTLRALQQMESGVSGGDNQSATCRPLRDVEERRYSGYTNPHKQSRSFQMLEQGLRMAESGQGGSAGPSSAGEPMPSGVRPVKAPVFDPSPHQAQQAQYMTCKGCGMLISGVFIRIKGEPLHPECFKCVKCGKNLKNQGYFMIDGQMHCEDDARQASQPGGGQDMQAVPVYR